MKIRYTTIILVFLLTTALGLFVLTGCNGGNTAGGEQDYRGTEFIGDASNSGSIEIDLKEDEIPVGEIAGFEVFVYDKDGQPVPDLRVSCDTELGLALVEPTTGTETTSDKGQISGKLGCANPGSLVVGCRIATGSVRKFATVKCRGDVPPGFTGFPGAGGGTLGGGVLNPGAGGPGGTDGRVRITSAQVTSAGNISSNSIDTSRCLCQVPSSGTPEPPTLEPFSDDGLQLTVVNGTENPIRPQYVRFTVQGIDESSTLDVSSEISPGSSGTIGVLLFDVTSSGGLSRKRVPRVGDILPFEPGFRNVTITLVSEDTAGNVFESTTSIALSFDEFNLCSAGVCISRT